MGTVDVKKIMHEIREEIAKKQVLSDDLSFDDLTQFSLSDHEDLKLYLDGLNNGYYIEAYRPINSRGGVLGKIIIFLKKILRKMMKFYVEPVVNDQRDFNANLVQVLNISTEMIAEQNRRILKLEKEISSLKKMQD